MEKTKSVKKEKPVKESNIFKDHKEKRDKISMIDKQRLARAHDEGYDYIDLGERLGLNRHTVQSIITRYRKTGELSGGKHGGHRKPIINDEIGKKLIERVEENPLRTLREMREYLKNMGVNLAFQTISNYLNGKCISLKAPVDSENSNSNNSNNNNNNNNDNTSSSSNNNDMGESSSNLKNALPILSFASFDRNSPEVKDRRHDYVKSILDNNISMKQCIFVGEALFNFWIVSPFGKNTRGTRNYKHCCGQKETSVTVCLAIATTGVVHYKVYFGKITKTNFEEFILELSMQLGDGHFYIIQDCTAIHLPVEPAFENHQLVFLPPHSSFLNPIATVIERLVAEVKSRVPESKEVVKMTLNTRKETLKRVIEQVVPEKFYSSMNSDYSATVKYFSKCISKEDIH